MFNILHYRAVCVFVCVRHTTTSPAFRETAPMVGWSFMACEHTLSS